MYLCNETQVVCTGAFQFVRTPFSEKRIADVAVQGSKLGAFFHRFLDTRVLKD